jgi:hypothetical protein
MRLLFSLLFFTTLACTIISCSGKSKGNSSEKDTTAIVNNDGPANKAEDSSLAPLRSFMEQGLADWMRSFPGLQIDSFRMTQKSAFEQTAYEDANDLSKFYDLYKAALNFSPDSNQFIDLYSAGVMLEKKGKKIIASADVDQAVTLCNLGTKEWKRIASFGPSAGIEEAVWVSASKFILAGIFYNDDGKPVPILLVGDTNDRSFRWYEANVIRPASSKYEASGMKKLKIDEWE